MGSAAKQFLAAVIASVPNVLFGALMAWPSYTLKLLSAEEGGGSPLSAPLSPLECSLVGSLPPLGALLGTALAPALLDRAGRRNGALLIGLPFIVSWSLVVVARGAGAVLAARAVGGLGAGATLIMSPVFISEVSEERIRGALASTPVWAYCAGVLVSYALGWACAYRTVLLAQLSLAVLYLGLMALMKETPVHLLRRNMEKEALASLAFYRSRSVADKEVLTELSCLRAQLHSPHELQPLPTSGEVAALDRLFTHRNALASLAFYRSRSVADKEVLTELSCLRAQLHSPHELQPLPTSESPPPEETGKALEAGDVKGGASEVERGLLEAPPARSAPAPAAAAPAPGHSGWSYLRRCAASRRALLISAAMVGLQVWMGMLAVQVYAGALFASAVPDLSPDLCSVLLALVMMLGSATAAAVVDRAGRRVLMIWLSLAVAVCLASLGSLLQLGWAPAWAVPLNIFLYCFLFNVGPGTVPFVLLAEMFVPEVQGVCTSLAVTVLWLMNSTLLGVFAPLQQALGAHGVFYLFAGVAALAAAASACILPETRGLSARQLQRLLAPPPPPTDQ